MRLLQFLSKKSFPARKGLLIICCMLPVLVSGQQWEWAVYDAFQGYDLRGVHVDKDGNTYLTSGSKTARSTSRHVFIQPLLNKLSPGGKIEWGDSVFEQVIATRSNGNVIVFGEIYKNMKLGPIDLILPATAKPGTYHFLAECSKEGHWLKARIICKGNPMLYPQILVDSHDDIYISGQFIGNELIFFPHDTVWNSEQNAGASQDVFLAKFDSNLQVSWAKTIGSKHSGAGLFSMQADKYNNICIGHSLYDPKTDEETQIIKKYSTDGKLIFEKEIGLFHPWAKKNNRLRYYFVIDRESNDFITLITSNVEREYGDGVIRKPPANDDVQYLARYDQNWNLKWIYPWGVLSSYVGINDLVIDKENNICMVGGFRDSLVVHNKTILRADSNGLFLIKLDGNGTVLQATAAAGPCYDWAGKLYVDDCENMYIWGGASCGNPDSSHHHYADLGRFRLSGMDNYYGLYFLAKLNAHNFGFDPKSSCIADTFHFKGDTAFKTFTWEFSDGSVLSGKDVVFHPKDTGWYYVELECHTAQGCSANYQDSIYRPANPKAFFSITEKKLCQYTTVSIADSSFPANVAAGVHTKHWDFGDGTSYDGLNPPQKAYSATGKYTIKLVYDLGFCADTFSRTVIVEPGALAGFTVSDSVGCMPLPVTVIPKTKDKALKYRYLFGDGSEDSVISPTHTYNHTGSYWLKQELTSSAGCVSKDSLRIRVGDGFTIADTPRITEIGYVTPNYVYIYVEHPNDIHYYDKLYRNQTGKRPVLLDKIQWTIGTKNYSWRDSLAEETPDQPFWYTVVSEDSCGHTSLPSKPAAPPLLFGNNVDNVFFLHWTPYMAETPRTIRYMLYANDTRSRLWNDSSIVANYHLQLNCLDSLWPTIEGQQCYRITATGGWAGGSNAVCIPKKPIIWIPDAFSPNKDGVNDTFRIVSFDIPELSISIYDRWGERVFSSSGGRIEWDGRKGGQVLPDGVYLFTLQGRTAQQEKIYKTGTINLLH